MGIDWQEIFIPSGSLLAIFVRGTIIYLVLFATMRLLPRRTIGTMGASDVLVIVLIADAVQNGMSDEYKSVTEGLFLALVLTAHRIGGDGAVNVEMSRTADHVGIRILGLGEPVAVVAHEEMRRCREILVGQHGGHIAPDPIGPFGAGLVIELPCGP